MSTTEVTRHQVNEFYLELTKKIRNSLIVLVQFALSFLILEIYTKEDRHELFISLSLIVIVLVTYYLIDIIPDLSYRFTYSLQLLILVNIVLANSVIDTEFYAFGSIIAYLGISIALHINMIHPLTVRASDTVLGVIPDILKTHYSSPANLFFSFPITESDMVMKISLILL